MSNLYELTAEYKALETAMLLNPESEEEYAELFSKINDEIEVKAENYGKIIKNLDADSVALSWEIKRLTDRKNSIDNTIKRLKTNLMESMKQTGKVKFKTDLFSFSVAKNGGKDPVILSVEPSELPEDLQKVTIEADSNKLRDYIMETGDLSYGVIGERGEHLLMR